MTVEELTTFGAAIGFGAAISIEAFHLVANAIKRAIDFLTGHREYDPTDFANAAFDDLMAELRDTREALYFEAYRDGFNDAVTKSEANADEYRSHFEDCDWRECPHQYNPEYNLWEFPE